MLPFFKGPHTISLFFSFFFFLLLLLTFVLYKKLKYMLLGGHKGEKHRFFGPKATFGQQGVHAQKYSPVLLFWDRNFRFWNFPIGWWKMLFKLHLFFGGGGLLPHFFWPSFGHVMPALHSRHPVMKIHEQSLGFGFMFLDFCFWCTFGHFPYWAVHLPPPPSPRKGHIPA